MIELKTPDIRIRIARQAHIFVKMRAAKYMKIIASQLEQFKDMKQQLENLLEDIKHIIHQGQSWIDETGNTLSFAQMNQLLASETSNCIQKCLNVTLEEDKMIPTTEVNISCSSSKISSPNSDGNTQSARDFNAIQIKLDEFDKRISEQSTKLKSLKQKVKRQEKQNEIISTQLSEKDKNTAAQLEEIMKELHAASDFVSNLQIQTEMLTSKQNENEKKLNDAIEKLTDQEERNKVLTTNQESDAKKLQAVVEEALHNRVMPLKGDFDILKSDLDSFKSSSDLNLRYFTHKNDEKFRKISREFNELSTHLTEMRHLNSKKSISFSVGLTAVTTVPIDCVVKYDKIFTNIGDCYDVSTGIFTCPVGGHYVFHINLTTDCNDWVILHLYQNIEYKISVYAHIPQCVSSNGNSVILHLKLSDKHTVFVKMRLAKYVKIITSQLEQFEDMKTQLENLLEDIKHIINQGQSWVEETGNTLSFTQINQLLTSETSNCIQKCLNIIDEENNPIDTTEVNIPCSSSKMFSPKSVVNTQSNIDFNDIQIRLDEFDKKISKQSTKFKSIKQKIKRQEKQNEISSSQLTEKDKNTEVKFEEIIKELHAASDFMSNLQSQTKMLTSEQNEHEKKMNNMIEKFTDQEERIKVLTTNQESDAKKLQAVVEEVLPNRIMKLDNVIEKLTDQEERIKVLTTNQESDAKKLQAVVEEVLPNRIMKLDNVIEKLTDQEERIKVLTTNQESDAKKLQAVIEEVLPNRIVKLDNVIEKLTDQEERIKVLTTNQESDSKKLQDVVEEVLPNRVMKLDNVIEKLTEQEERIKVLTTNQESDSKKLQDVVEEVLPNRVMRLKGYIDIVKSDLDSFKSSSGLNLRYFTDKNDEFQNQVDKKFTKMSTEFKELSTDLSKMIFKEISNSNSKKILFSVGLAETTMVEMDMIVKYNKIITNIGDCYNVSTGVFTCSLGGFYHFNVGIMSGYAHSILALYQNNEYKISMYAHNEKGLTSCGNATILYLNRDDLVYLKSSINSKLYGNSPKLFNTFTGFLLNSV
ncbi:hypothetical protein Btru_033850 [Bulinus truncatus]|nr:hypothetical protein Btru_033850 [Bulinus truncatus]